MEIHHQATFFFPQFKIKIPHSWAKTRDYNRWQTGAEAPPGGHQRRREAEALYGRRSAGQNV